MPTTDSIEVFKEKFASIEVTKDNVFKINGIVLPYVTDYKVDFGVDVTKCCVEFYCNGVNISREVT